MKINLEMSNGTRRIVLRNIWWCKTNKAWHVGVDKKYRFANHRQVRLTAVIHWLRTGRKLRKGEVLHHADHDPQNNLWRNLERTTRARHSAHHHKGATRSALTRRRLSASAKMRADTPAFRKMASARAKRQHRAKNFGAHTWRSK